MTMTVENASDEARAKALPRRWIPPERAEEQYAGWNRLWRGDGPLAWRGDGLDGEKVWLGTEARLLAVLLAHPWEGHRLEGLSLAYLAYQAMMSVRSVIRALDVLADPAKAGVVVKHKSRGKGGQGPHEINAYRLNHARLAAWESPGQTRPESWGPPRRSRRSGCDTQSAHADRVRAAAAGAGLSLEDPSVLAALQVARKADVAEWRQARSSELAAARQRAAEKREAQAVTVRGELDAILADLASRPAPAAAEQAAESARGDGDRAPAVPLHGAPATALASPTAPPPAPPTIADLAAEHAGEPLGVHLGMLRRAAAAENDFAVGTAVRVLSRWMRKEPLLKEREIAVLDQMLEEERRRAARPSDNRAAASSLQPVGNWRPQGTPGSAQ
jgi:hypothetical protein